MKDLGAILTGSERAVPTGFVQERFRLGYKTLIDALNESEKLLYCLHFNSWYLFSVFLKMKYQKGLEKSPGDNKFVETDRCGMNQMRSDKSPFNMFKIGLDVAAT